MEAYRCGYCGQSTDSKGVPLSLEKRSELTEKQFEEAQQTHGYCCHEEAQQDNYVVITKEMAYDAGDPSLEGALWKW